MSTKGEEWQTFQMIISKPAVLHVYSDLGQVSISDQVLGRKKKTTQIICIVLEIKSQLRKHSCHNFNNIHKTIRQLLSS